MLRNACRDAEQTGDLRVLNEVLSLNAQEFTVGLGIPSLEHSSMKS